MNRLSPVAILLGLALTAPAAFAATLVVDPFTSPFPPNPCLPNSGHQVIFYGPYCDGVSCPPGPIVDPLIQVEYCYGVDTQAPLPGVLGGQRSAVIGFPNGSTEARAFAAVDGEGWLVIDSQQGAGARVEVYYQGPNLSEPSLDADLSDATQFRMMFQGDITPENPVYLSIMLVDWNPFPVSGPSVWADLTITQPGEWMVPRASFATNTPGAFDWDSVDDIHVVLSGCYENCGAFPARQYRMGAIQVDTAGPTAAGRPSWGAVKLLYR